MPPRDDLVSEPLPFKDKLDFILMESARYLTRAPNPADIKTIWVGLRPLVKPQDDNAGSTPALSREHTVLVGQSGLVTVTGGKWTTYRAMAEDVLDHCFEASLLQTRERATAQLQLAGAKKTGHSLSAPPGLRLYGCDAAVVNSLDGAGHVLGGGLAESMVRFTARI